MKPEFRSIKGFEEAISLANNLVHRSTSGYTLNFSLKVSFNSALLREPQLLDAARLARDFQRQTKPKHLYINHGEYIGRQGVNHIIAELRDKHKGNRALMSLISQQHIIGSSDKPIPSFMILQFSLENRTLYVTAYFRALEVAKFLRINLEEIRLVASRIAQALPNIRTVNLNVFAFRAYIKKSINPLLRPRIETLSEGKLLKIMEKDPASIAELLREMITESTVIDNRSIRTINRILRDKDTARDIHPILKEPYVRNRFRQCQILGEQLLALRARVSHAEDLQSMTAEYLKSLREAVAEIEEKTK